MRTLWFLLQKEFRQIFRNRTILPIIFVMPIMQLMVLPQAANYEVRNINLTVLDYDHSTESHRLVQKVISSGYFRLVAATQSQPEAYRLLEADKTDIILTIPSRFERNAVRDGRQTLHVAVNAINGVKANLGGAYLSSILSNYRIAMPDVAPPLEIVPSNWFNPTMNYKVFMVPGILALLVTMIGANLTALNIVKEKEVGTMDQLNVTPIRKYQFILGKLIPFWVIGMLITAIGLTIARVVYGIVPVGSLLTIFAFVGVYLVCVLGLGLLVSTFAETQQQAMFVAFFFMMIFILLGGLFTSIDSMPPWAQTLTRFNPVRYFIEVMRMVVLKGSTLADISSQILIVAGFGVLLNTAAIMNYRKTV